MWSLLKRVIVKRVVLESRFELITKNLRLHLFIFG